MHSSSPRAHPHTEDAPMPAPQLDAIEAGSSDGHNSSVNTSPRSQNSHLSSSSSISDDGQDRRRSQYHDIAYLKSLAESGTVDDKLRIVGGAEARHFLGQFQNNADFRDKSGPMVIARTVVTDTGRRIVDYARTWRGDTKAHRNKGPRRDFLAGEFKRAEDIQKFFEQSLTEKVSDEQAKEQDYQLKRVLSELDKDFRRLSATAADLQGSLDKVLPPSTPKKVVRLTVPDPNTPTKHSEPLSTNRKNHRLSELSATLVPISSATASVQSLPRLGPISGLAAHDSPLRLTNPDPNSPTVDSFSGTADSAKLTIVVLDDENVDGYKDWELRHPTRVIRRTPTQRRSQWDGPLTAPPVPDHHHESIPSPHTHSHSRKPSPTTHNPPPNHISTNPSTERSTPPIFTVQPPPHSPHIPPPPHSFPKGTPGSAYVPQVPAYTPQSIYAPSQSHLYKPLSVQTQTLSPYASSQLTYGSTFSTPTSQSPYTLSPYAGSQVTLSPYNGSQTVLSPYGGSQSLPYGGSQSSPYGSQVSLSPYALSPMNINVMLPPLHTYQYMGQ